MRSAPSLELFKEEVEGQTEFLGRASALRWMHRFFWGFGGGQPPRTARESSEGPIQLPRMKIWRAAGLELLKP